MKEVAPFGAFVPRVIFEKTWGGFSDDIATGIANDSAGNLYVSGYTYSFCCPAPKAFLLKYDSNATLLWQRTWESNHPDDVAPNDTIAYALAVDGDGNAYLAGSSYYSSTSLEDALVLKFSPSGEPLWQRSWGGLQNDRATAIAVDSRGGVYVAGTTPNNSTGLPMVFLLRFLPDGSLVWQRTWQIGTFGVSVQALAVDLSGNVYLAGASSIQAFLLKFISNGTLEWQALWGGDGHSSADALTVTPSGNILVTGYANNSNRTGGLGMPLLELDPSGRLLWERVYRVPGFADGTGLAVDASGNIYLTGRFRLSYPPPNGILLLKFNSTGYLLWQAGDSSTTGQDYGVGILVDSAGRPIIAGSVREGPPYTMTRLSYKTDIMPVFPIMPSPGTIDMRPCCHFLAIPHEAIRTPTGGQTYAGSTDVYLLKAQSPVPSVPSPPLALVAQPGGANVSLSWAPPECDGGSIITAIRVYRGPSSGAERLLVTVPDRFSFIDENVVGGATYYYYVTAVNAAGESAPSNEAQAGLGGLFLAVTPTLGEIMGGIAVGAVLIAVFLFQRRRKYLRF